ncbi:MAG: competence type IV pilus major pilin ComGC [Candidatus Omnitrophota bacterium]
MYNINNSLNRAKRRNGLEKKGFTLVEIMVVVAAIGILAMTFIPTLMRARNAARKQACIANLKTIEVAKPLWAVQEEKTSQDVPAWSDLIPAYIKKTPACPAGGIYIMRSSKKKPTCTQAGHDLL